MPKNKIRKDIHEATTALTEIMREGLKQIAELEIKQVMKNYRSLTPARKVDATKDLTQSGVNDYKNVLLNSMAVIVADALDKAKEEVPTKKKIKLQDWDEEAVQFGEFDKLPASIKKRVKAQVDLLVQTQKNDLDKSIFLQFNSSVNSTDSESLLESDINEAADKYIDGPAIPAGASVVSARGINEARQAYFFEPDVLEEIEAFEFRNDVPETPICEDLNGTIFSKTDPGFDRYNPPLHFNAILEDQCISTIDGIRLIQEIKKGDFVLTHKSRFMPVVEVMTKFEDKEYLLIELEDGNEIRLTGEHPVLCKRGWIRADNLNMTDDIITIEDILNVFFIR